MRYGILVILGFAALLGLSAVFGSWYTVDQGERGVILRNGAVIDTAEPGLGFKLPFIDSVVKTSIQSQSRHYTDLAAYSSDQQPTVMQLSVNWHIPADKVEEVYSVYGGEEGLVTRLLDRRVNEQVKNIFGKYTAVRSIQQRTQMNMDMEVAVRDIVKGPIVIDSLQIENIDFSDAYEASIEQRMLAEVEVQKLHQNAEREKVQAEITVTQAKATADATLAKATADADAIRLRGDAEADAIRAKSAALQQSPQLIELTKAERWDGKLPTTVLPNGTIPFIDAAK